MHSQQSGIGNAKCIEIVDQITNTIPYLSFSCFLFNFFAAFSIGNIYN